MTELFNAPDASDDQSDAYLEEVKAKFTRDGQLDVDALLKAKAESDKFIKRLEGENQGVREEMNKRATFDELLKKINEQRAQGADGSNHEPDAGEADEPNKYNPDDIRKMVSETFNQEQTKAAQAKNVEQVKDALSKNWGSNFADKLKQVTKDLELTQEEAGFMAATRPKAFLKLVLGDKAPVGNYAPPSSSVRVEHSQKPSGDKTYSYYKSMLNSPDPAVRARYWDPSTQNKIHALALELGDAFLNN
jgi:hypothetical protein